MPSPPVAIVGAGVSGLAAAWRLRTRGVDAVLLEASDRIGGAVRSLRAEGFLADLGPNTLVVRDPRVEEVLQRLGLAARRLWADPAAARRYVVRDGRPVPLPTSPLGLLRTPLLSTRARLRLLAEPFVRRGHQVDESLAAFVRRRLGPEVLDYVADPFVAGVFAGDPERLSARHAAPALVELERTHGSLLRGALAQRRAARTAPSLPRHPFSFPEGLEALPHALAAALAGAVPVHLGERVTTLGREAGGFRLGPHGPFRAVVWATPPYALPDGVGSPNDLAIVRGVPCPPVAVLALGFRREDVAHPLDGFGVLVPRREPFRLLGALFSSTLTPGRAPDGHALLTCFLGGARRPDDALRPEAELLAVAQADLARLLGVRGDPVFARCRVWRRAIPQYEVGHDTVLAALDRLEAATPGLFVAGTVRGGISVGEALAAGLVAADRAAAHLGA